MTKSHLKSGQGLLGSISWEIFFSRVAGFRACGSTGKRALSLALFLLPLLFCNRTSFFLWLLPFVQFGYRLIIFKCFAP